MSTTQNQEYLADVYQNFQENYKNIQFLLKELESKGFDDEANELRSELTKLAIMGLDK